jgi:hypothetical protein
MRHWVTISETDMALIRSALPDLWQRLSDDIAENASPAAVACKDQATDDDGHTPEWDGAVSFCEDGKAWVMTWELVDNPLAAEMEVCEE